MGNATLSSRPPEAPARSRPVRGHDPGQSPPARRLPRVGLRDLRLWLGVAIMAGSMIAGARILSSGDDTVIVWRASRDLPAGATPVAEPFEVQLGGAAAAYLPASTPLQGRVRTAIPAGALIPADAIGEASMAGIRLVTLAVDPLHAPVGITAGDLVDIWATGVDGANELVADPAIILPRVLVSEVDAEQSGVSGEMAVVVEVPQERAGDLVAAARSRVLDLVAVPLDAAGPTSGASS